MTATLLVTVDTEEEFDWNAPFSRENTSVQHAAQLPRLQQLFEDVGVRPTYVVDHPIASAPESVEVLQDFLRRDACEIGAHCHPWVNPPFDEEVNPRNSYLCNLPVKLQKEKLRRLTGAIEEAFDDRPATFKAGRYGIDFELVPFLQSLGYRVDTSVIAYMDLTADGGPDFSYFGNKPVALAPPLFPYDPEHPPLVEVPCTVGFSRRPFSWWAGVHRKLAADRLRPLHPVGILWHLRIMRKIVLTPEGTELSDQIRLLKVLGREPDAVLNLTLHSPSIQPGNTPFVRSDADLQAFLDRLRSTLEFALGRLGARPLTFRQFAAEFARNGRT